MGKMSLDTPFVKLFMIASLAFCIFVAIHGPADSAAKSSGYTDSAQSVLAGRTDAELNEVGTSLCKMYEGGSSIDQVTTHLINRGSTPDSADQLARLAIVYKCPDVLEASR